MVLKKGKLVSKSNKKKAGNSESLKKIRLIVIIKV
jgi:hypothetical protein